VLKWPAWALTPASAALCACCCHLQQVTLSAGAGGEQRGIYLREPHESQGPASFTANIRPLLHEVRPCLQSLRQAAQLSLL
jgi:hypothetical protein